MTQQQSTHSPSQAQSADLAALLLREDLAAEKLLGRLIELHCRLAGAECGVLMRLTLGRGSVDLLAVHPPLLDSGPPPVWLAQSAELAPRVLESGRTTIVGVDESVAGVEPGSTYLILMPIGHAAQTAGIAAYRVRAEDAGEVARIRARLEAGVGLLTLHEFRSTMRRTQLNLDRLSGVLQTLASINQHSRFRAFAMALCAETASRFACERVTFGTRRGRYVQLIAMNDSDKIVRKMQLVQQLEAAMEECFDQDQEIAYPPQSDAIVICRETRQLSDRFGPSSILSLPVRREGEVNGVITLEREADRPFHHAEIESLRLLGDLAGPRLFELAERDRWIGARLTSAGRKGMAWLVGPRHTWAKLAGVLVLGFLIFAVLKQGTARTSAPFTIRPVQSRVIAAPFDGTLRVVNVVPGDEVSIGTELASLDQSAIRFDLAAAMADRQAAETEAATMRSRGELAGAKVAEARAAEADARIQLYNYQLEQAVLKAPITGVITQGDLDERVGARLALGEPLLEIAPLDVLQAELRVPEHRIAELEPGMRGHLATASFPDRRLEFTVADISPVAQVLDGENVFRVKATLSSRPEWLRPGMEGVAKVELGTAPLARIWTQDLVKWIRMKLWL